MNLYPGELPWDMCVFETLRSGHRLDIDAVASTIRPDVFWLISRVVNSSKKR